mmetsp:Transcript_1220/g.2821  ORF Transcript_1220/g.2821 Transcript_1220/m.2821 type:complete len:317 (-) Transcript_1220:65-1015(-)|eukprot:CAMPEP_0197609128 /NCGR_PEP_ID=MMETSP1326-20131121/50523_1 /TAXON_ID=1155430 /ORGANISM="Genus nov. species nov., Strain RCC2288" /LENGTH=316 /DNA_ID=CAMNT_0043177447 /DNA_START=367 /DNA_END=1317 /DNA_ORIENTATION=+
MFSWNGVHVCKKCRQPPAEGEKLRYCKGCKMAYCGVDCQRADWETHKLDCEAIRENKREGEVYNKANGLGGGGKEMRLALLGWYDTVPHVMMEVLCLAWRHRASSPVIKVTTSADGADAHAPLITVVPRSAWAASGNATAAANFFDRAGFHVDTDYVVTFDLLHPGSEAWPKGHIQQMGFNSCMPTLIENLEAQVRQHSATYSAAQPAATRVHLTGLRGAAHFNGREGEVRADPANSERVIVRLGDGTELSVKADNCEVIRGMVRLVGLVRAAHINGSEGVVCGMSPANPERVMVRLADGVKVSVKRENYELIINR